MRYTLLSKVDEYAKYLTSKNVSHILPYIESGFQDQDWRIREKSVISIIYLASKLSSNQLNESKYNNQVIFQIIF